MSWGFQRFFFQPLENSNFFFQEALDNSNVPAKTSWRVRFTFRNLQNKSPSSFLNSLQHSTFLRERQESKNALTQQHLRSYICGRYLPKLYLLPGNKSMRKGSFGHYSWIQLKKPTSIIKSSIDTKPANQKISWGWSHGSYHAGPCSHTSFCSPLFYCSKDNKKYGDRKSMTFIN